MLPEGGARVLGREGGGRPRILKLKGGSWADSVEERLARSMRILLLPQDLPLASSKPRRSSLFDLNLTKPKPLCFLEHLSVGMKESMTLPALTNIASSSALEMAEGRLETKREKVEVGGRLLQAGSRFRPLRRSIPLILSD